jgi:hypothetical protein
MDPAIPRRSPATEEEAMPETSVDFGSWLTAPDGTAHYVMDGKCLCGANVKKWGGAPKRDRPVTGPPRKYLTPLCQRCLDQNYLRWAKKGGLPTHVLAQRLDRRHRRSAFKKKS